MTTGLIAPDAAAELFVAVQSRFLDQTKVNRWSAGMAMLHVGLTLAIERPDVARLALGRLEALLGAATGEPAEAVEARERGEIRDILRDVGQ